MCMRMMRALQCRGIDEIASGLQEVKKRVQGSFWEIQWVWMTDSELTPFERCML